MGMESKTVLLTLVVFEGLQSSQLAHWLRVQAPEKGCLVLILASQ